jgi:outer membrane receptor protein involved in Fe transport
MGGVTMGMTKHLDGDASIRRSQTRNRQTSTAGQSSSEFRALGVYVPVGSSITNYRSTALLNGRTYGGTLRYRATPWWSHALTLGSDENAYETTITEPSYRTPRDTGRFATNTRGGRMSQSYNTTMLLPVTSLARLNLTLGGDHSRTASMSWQGSLNSATGGTIQTPSVARARPTKTSGAFAQGQLAIMDALFLTYGLRAEWNPNIGDKAKVLPGRYGVSYTKDIGSLTAKLRGSYGRSIRPPGDDLKLGITVKDAYTLERFGPGYQQLPNPELMPEFQQGGEGGVELYFGNRGSLVVTRYNQTVNRLIYQVYKADSVKSLINNLDFYSQFGYTCADLIGARFTCDGYEYNVQSQYLNVGSIRNQGWELQGSIRLGSLTTRGTYSWTKSRVIGITPRYRSLLVFTEFQSGRPFDYVPEHTWATGFNYTNGRGTIDLGIHGISQRYVSFNSLDQILNLDVRLLLDRPLQVQSLSARNVRSIGAGYATADLNMSQRLSSRIDATLGVSNLTNYYQNDLSADYASMGRQTRLGLRWRVN